MLREKHDEIKTLKRETTSTHIGKNVFVYCSLRWRCSQRSVG